MISFSKDPKTLANLLTGEVFKELNPFECPVCMENCKRFENLALTT